MEGHLNRRQLLEKTLGVFGAVASTAITAEQFGKFYQTPFREPEDIQKNRAARQRDLPATGAQLHSAPESNSDPIESIKVGFNIIATFGIATFVHELLKDENH